MIRQRELYTKEGERKWMPEAEIKSYSALTHLTYRLEVGHQIPVVLCMLLCNDCDTNKLLEEQVERATCEDVKETPDCRVPSMYFLGCSG